MSARDSCLRSVKTQTGRCRSAWKCLRIAAVLSLVSTWQVKCETWLAARGGTEMPTTSQPNTGRLCGGQERLQERSEKCRVHISFYIFSEDGTERAFSTYSTKAFKGRIHPPIKGQKDGLHTTVGIRWWSPTQLLIYRFEAYVWQSERDAQFSSICGRM